AVAPGEAETLLRSLINVRAFPEAYAVWSRMRDLPGDEMQLRDGGFEEAIDIGTIGFGWQIPSGIPNAKISQDTTEHQSGNRSLRIDFHDYLRGSSALLSQIVLVKPATRYRLSFSARSKDLVAAASLIMAVNDSSSPGNESLGASSELRSEGAWHDFQLDFTTGA